MQKDIHVLIIEDDLYARDLMTLLLTRDWRTRVVGEAGSEDDVVHLIQQPAQRIDLIIIDTEVPGDAEWPFRVARLARSGDASPRILCTATKPDLNILKRLLENDAHGYVIKREVRYCLAHAIAMVARHGKWVTTPGVFRAALREHIQLPENTVVLDGTRPVASLTPRENEVARLAILFNMAHRDLSDELVIRADQVAKYVSNAYTKIGLDEILSGEIKPEVYFQDETVLRHLRKILTRLQNSKSRRKTVDMSTLAFHLLTVPEVSEWT